MIDAALEALAFARGRMRADLDTDRMLALSLVKEIEIIGEAASKVSDEVKRSTPHIPWADITGMRHRLIHAYFDIDLDVVWKTLQSDLPPLVKDLQELLAR